MLDYTFGHLGLSNESSIEYPVLLTEPMCNPNYCRTNTSELLFECYRASAVSYSVDSLLSFYYNASKRDEDVFSAANTSGLIISSSNSASHIIPIFDGTVSQENTKRLPLGGSHHFELMNKSLNLKYAQHKSNLQSPDAIQYIMENHT
jgi:actin-related protein 5